MQQTWSSAIEDHYREAWGDFVPCLYDKGVVEELPADFGVLCFPPRSGRDMWTYATCAMSQPEDAYPLELHMFSPQQNGGIVEILHAVAHYHRTGARLDVGHSVNLGVPWLPFSRCDRGLISLPYLDGSAVEVCDVRGGAVRCLWLIPITGAEADYKQLHGLDALEQRFELAGFNYLDPNRASVV